MKLYDLPRGSKMRIEFSDPVGTWDCTFHHLDGMYSYCTIDNGDEQQPPFHLKATTPMKKVGDHYEIDINPTKEAE